jgi:hypothetical protein
LIQNFRKGLVVVARNLKCLLKRIKVVMFQLMMKTPIAKPTITVLKKLTSPRYSGARYSESTPYACMKEPFTALNNINQNNISTWNFLKWSNTS